jgi:high affinity Mn2+ porin
MPDFPETTQCPRARRGATENWFLAVALATLLLQVQLPVARAADTVADTTADTAPAPQPTAEPGDAASSADGWNLHGQFTNVTQWHPSFRSPYRGAMSFDPTARMAETSDITAYLGVRLWPGAAVFLDPEIDQGFGLSDTVGIAGFPSGEAYKIGANAPYQRLPRAFVRQVINLGGTTTPIDDAANQLASDQAENRLTLTLGKFSVVDVFDTNDYAHDPRADFMNWSVIDSGAFDYAADSWGFTYGAALEWTEASWTLRAGVFDLSTIPNGKQPDPGFAQYEGVIELEQRFQWQDHPGKLKLLAFTNHGRMGSYEDALAFAQANQTVPAVAAVRRVQSRSGVVLNFQQELAADLGIFARLGANDGTKEAYEFTDINRSLSAGLSLRGDRWDRHDDTVGLALATNQISNQARAYLGAGGLGILVGDGKLNYASENIIETYYSVHLKKGLTLSVDYQRVENPAYNRDRGPVSILGVRIHGEL